MIKITLNDKRWYNLEDLPNEIWKDIGDFESLYSVSNYGRVKSHDRCVMVKHWDKYVPQFKKGCILRLHKNNKGYIMVHLHKNGKMYNRLLHRVVVEAFIPNPNNLPEVNHDAENKENCRFDNLTWCTRAYNNNYGIQSKEGRRKTSQFRMKPVAKYDMNNNLIAVYAGMRVAEEKTGINHRNIGKCCQNNNKEVRYRNKDYTTGGYIWRYMKEGDENETYSM